MVLKEYFHTRLTTTICNKYNIAVSTLYAWRDRYLSHVSIDLGAVVEAALLKKPDFLSKAALLEKTIWFSAAHICKKDAIRDFFYRFGFSFMQYNYHAEATFFSSA
jgi:hypothetical protein